MFNTIVVIVSVLLGLVTAAHAMMFKRQSRAAVGWVAVCLMVPFGGPFLYYVFGVNRVQKRARRLLDLPVHGWQPPKQLRANTAIASNEAVQSLLAPTDPRIVISRISAAVGGRPLVPGNNVQALLNGDEAFPAMLQAIDSAERSVYLMTYILEMNNTGNRFLDSLVAAQDRGVDVRVLIDGVGNLYHWPRANRALRKRGIRTVRFLPPRLLPPLLRINMRNHRKILVVDGNVGFTGGMNIGDRHLVSSPSTGRGGGTRDMQFRIEGGIVQELELVFADSWQFATDEGTPVSNIDYADDPEPGKAMCRVILTGPDDNADKLVAVLIGAITAATKRVDIVTPYFLPPRELIAAMQSAALRGVSVRIVLPERSNLPYVDWATRNMLWELLLRDVNVYLQPPPFEHTKLLVVDDEYVQLGSANIDPRSLRLNFELIVEVYDTDFGRWAGGYVDGLIANSRQITLAEVDSRSIPVRLRDSFFWLFSPYL